MLRRTLAIATTIAAAAVPTLAMAVGADHNVGGPNSAAVVHDMVVWFGNHPGVTYAMAIGSVAFAVGLILNRE